MNKVLIVASVASMIDQFNMPNIKILQDLGYEVNVACNFKNGSTCTDEKIIELRKKLDVINVKCIQINFARSPFSKQTLIAYKQLKNIIRKGKYTFVHSHAPVSGILSRFAARKARKKGTKVIYTAHGFHFFKGAPLFNWLTYYPLEKICSYFTDVLITLNTEDFELAKKKMKARKICYIPGVGLDTSKFSNVNIDKSQKRKEFGLNDKNIILFSVGELNKNKNHKVIIEALSKIKDKNIHYIVAGSGSLLEENKKIADDLGIKDNVHFLGYRSDISDLFAIADIYVHPSFREGLSVALMEALGSGLPCVISKIRGNVDLIQENQGGFLVEPHNIDGFTKGIEYFANNKNKRLECGEFNKEYIKNFDICKVDKIMREIYEEVLL